MATTYYTTEAAAERHKGHTPRYFQERCIKGEFPHAVRSKNGRWQIPEDDLNRHFGIPQENVAENTSGKVASRNTRIMNDGG